MVFGFLKPSFQVDIRAGRVPAGGPIEYEVLLRALKDKEVKKLIARFRVVLEGRARCEYREEDEEGEETTSSRIVDYQVTLAGYEKTILERARPPKGTHAYKVSFAPSKPLPLPGSYRHFRVRWIAEAEIPGLLRQPRAHAELAVEPPKGHGPPKTTILYLAGARVELETPQPILRGIPFQARARFTAEEETECRRLTARLVNRTRIDWRDADHTAESCDTPREERELAAVEAGDVAVKPGVPGEATITLTIPGGEAPSFNTGSSYSEWRLVLSCDRSRWRKDRVEAPLTII